MIALIQCKDALGPNGCDTIEISWAVGLFEPLLFVDMGTSKTMVDEDFVGFIL